MDTVLSAVARLEKMIETLIAYASTARGEMTLSFESVPVIALLEVVVPRGRAMAEKKGVHFDLRLAPDLPAVRADAEKLRWALLQLLDNAVKFTPTGGRLIFSAGPDNGLVRIAVQDTGIGIPAHRLHEVFEEFRQLDGSPTRHYGGTGLGLALVRRIVEAHGARIVIESEEGRGSTFSFSLPAAERPTAGGR
jgi:signal transduction histidine kinase